MDNPHKFTQVIRITAPVEIEVTVDLDGNIEDFEIADTPTTEYEILAALSSKEEE